MTPKPVSSTLWVLITLLTVVVAGCLAICLLGLATYEITGQVQP